VERSVVTELSSAGNASERSYRILIVDDNRDAADSLALVLGLHGHVLRTATSGTEAVQAASEFLPQLVLLDLALPGMSGYEIARRLREIPGLQSVRIIAVTGYGGPSHRKLSEESGFYAHLLKPVDLSVLDDLIKAVPLP